MSKDEFPELHLQAPPQAWAFAAYVSSQWTLRGLVALGIITAAQAEQLINWAAEDCETVAGDLGMRSAALVRALAELPPINTGLKAGNRTDDQRD